MRPVLSLLLGPEGLWITISLVVYLVAASNEPWMPAVNELLETLWLAIPLGGIPLTFLTAFLPGGGGWWWLLRVVVVSSVGVLVASFIAGSGVNYHDSRSSGLLGAPAYSLSIGLLLLVPPPSPLRLWSGGGTVQRMDSGAGTSLCAEEWEWVIARPTLCALP